jgi:hypothetical protein
MGHERSVVVGSGNSTIEDMLADVVAPAGRTLALAIVWSSRRG